MKYILGCFCLFFIVFLYGCIEEKNTENEQPIVEIISPAPCDTLYFGQPFSFKIKITDNTGLGNISMDIHHNFGHHSHGDHETCNMDLPKEAVNPYENTWIFALPPAETDYIFETEIELPENENETTFYDFGDYHFHIYVTDNEGYQVFTTLDTKLLQGTK